MMKMSKASNWGLEQFEICKSGGESHRFFIATAGNNKYNIVL